MSSFVEKERAINGKQQAWRAFNEGNFVAARKTCSELYSSGYSDEELTYLLGCCYAKLNDMSEAINYFMESLSFDGSGSNLPYTYIALGAAYMALDNIDKAIAYYNEAVSLDSDIYEAHIGLGNALMLLEKHEEAKTSFYNANKLVPSSGRPYHALGIIEMRKGNMELAAKYFKQALECEPESAEYSKRLGAAFIFLYRFKEALPLFEFAMEKLPDDENVISGLSIVYSKLGRYVDAMSMIDTAIKNNIVNVDIATSFLLAGKRLDQHNDAITYAEKCFNELDIHEEQLRNLHAELALTLDHAGKYDEAWRHITECKKYKYATNVHDESVIFKNVIDQIKSAFTPATMFSLPYSKVEHECTPIFLVGMPRSGSSLIEQIISIHPKVTACGELLVINDIITKIPSYINSDKPWPACISDMNQGHVDEMSIEYLRQIDDVQKQTPFITDKMPHNFLALGLIQKLFPNARIIHCKRNPLDTCVSIYFAHFEVGHEYSGSLFDIGAHYKQYLSLMDHWKNYLRIPIHDVNYETLVCDTEKTVRSLLEYCGLEWEPECLDYNRSSRMVVTASYDQVKQPIYSSSIDRWKHYEKYLDDLKSGLERGY